METRLSCVCYRFKFCSYRTYEEWKPQYPTLNSAVLRTGSYRTYEEWKPEGMFNKHYTSFSSYRTYEEWKH